MKLKSEIKKVITANTNDTAFKVWKPEICSEDLDRTQIMTLEITVRKKKRK